MAIAGQVHELVRAALRDRWARSDHFSRAETSTAQIPFVVPRAWLLGKHAGDSFAYPDLMVICGLASKIPARPSVITNPVLIAEVLSPGTEAYDRGEKARLYRASPTVKQYALLSQDQPLIEIHTRHDDGTWRITEVSGLESVCEFSSLDCSIPLSDLYEGVLDA